MKRKNYAVTESAEADLRIIVEYYSLHSMAYVNKLKHLFRDCFRRVCRQPNAGKPRDELSPGLRSLVVDSKFIVCFRREGNTTNIVRVIHGARNITSAFFNPPADEPE